MQGNILIVEDDPDGQVVIAHVLSHLNYDCDVVNDAESAEQKLHTNENQYHAIIIDLALPGMSGWDLLKIVRDLPTISDVICIALTGFHSSKTREQALKAGFDAYFTKPLDASRLAGDLESIL